jgi:two-component system sensor histidine kinase KdpD
MSMAADRPNPDELLAHLAQQEAKEVRGKLKVFFGMAAGVGKTYAMLEEARARAAEGLDVVIGYAEPHIRTETEALLLGMEILPYKLVEYRNAKLKEFDLDAGIKRHPSVMCVDELAHTNAPGMRHAKRWQDVSELLDAGINVYSTLNVQHLESFNDVIERITGVKVRETLPDSVLEQADEVELVDIAPEELLERFEEGKIYRPEQAERAARHFFTKGNLIALRELALRKTADRVDAQMQDFRRENVIRRSWATSERIIVCISPSPLSTRLVRGARRLASGLRAPLIAAYVETPKRRPSARDRQRLDQTLRLAEQLGAQTVTLTGENVADELIAYAAAKNVTKIVIGKPLRSRWRDFIFGSVVDDLVRKSDQADVYVIRGEAEDAEPQPRSASPPSDQRRLWDWRGYGAAVATVTVATLIGWVLYHQLHVENENVLMLYLLGVLWVATHYSRSAAVLASVLGVATFDFVFVPPYLTFAVSDQQYLVTFGVMLTAALVISALTHRVRLQVEMARQRERRTAALHALSRELAASRATEDIVSTSVRQIEDVFNQRAILLLPDGDKHLVAKNQSPTSEFDEKDRSVAQWAYEHHQIAGAGTSTLPAAHATFIPLKGSRGTVGVLGIMRNASVNGLEVEQRQLLEAFASQTAVAVERATAMDDARQAWERVEAEFLRNTLLSGVSHELRTPLAAITGAATALSETADRLPESAKLEMIDTIIAEADRMERLITNLLDMTRMESGGLVLKKEWVPIQEIVGSALRQLSRRLHGREIITKLPGDLPPINGDVLALEQVLANLLDNAVEYTPPDTLIEIAAFANEQSVTIEVSDRGPGLPAGAEKRVFEKFFRASHPDVRSRRGIGLGLAICRSIIEAHGGTITADNRAGGGATFRFTLPIGGTPPSILPTV